ncbi:BhlA/UviB family holin-like peptide [Paenilisteria newyorkensis]|uniref:BhlA/UviB family holin-like peptide n=1 Tax=Listeria newyorkensis TaxID=1497681 RepID=UPI000740CEE7|nr:BhlA/UviB family holin-like peptide [Listeria newyorkensis]
MEKKNYYSLEVIITGLENLVANATEITFGILFVALLVWMMRKNDEREERYQRTIDNLSELASEIKIIEQAVKEMRADVIELKVK